MYTLSLHLRSSGFLYAVVYICTLSMYAEATDSSGRGTFGGRVPATEKTVGLANYYLGIVTSRLALFTRAPHPSPKRQKGIGGPVLLNVIKHTVVFNLLCL